MKMKKLIASLLALCLVLSLTAACAEAKNYNTVEAGKFIYATSPDFLPFEGRDDQDNVIGIEPDIVALICEKLGLTPKPTRSSLTPPWRRPARARRTRWFPA